MGSARRWVWIPSSARVPSVVSTAIGVVLVAVVGIGAVLVAVVGIAEAAVGTVTTGTA